MGNSQAKPSSSGGHVGAMYPIGSSGARPRAPSGVHSGAAPPSLMNPMGSSAGARPRASPTAPSSSDGHAGATQPCSTNLATSSGSGETTKPEYPRRPGVADCTYYLKFGTCGYGMKCWFNHPDLHGRTGGGIQSQASNPSEHSNNKQYFSRKACNYNHQKGKNEVEPVKTNFLGLPLRPGAGLCSYYMRQGTCKFGTNCKFNHPDPKSEHVNLNASEHVVQESSQQNFSLQPIQQTQNEEYVPLVTSPSSGTSEIIPSPASSTRIEQHAYETTRPIHYTRHQLFELRENVGASKDILEFKRDIDVDLARDDLNVQPQSCNPYDGTDMHDWLSQSAQIPVVASEQKYWDNIFEVHKKMYELYAPSGQQEKFNKHDQLNSQLDLDDQVPSIQRGNFSDKEGVLMAVKSILENLTPDQFDRVKDQLIEAGITKDDILEDVITIMFEKAIFHPTFCTMYAQLCAYLNKKLPSSPPGDGKELAFTSVLLNTCHEVFEGAGNLCAEIDKLNDLDKEMETQNKELMLMKLRTIGNIRLIGELLKKQIITEKIVDHTIQMDENKQGKPDWDTFATKVFCDICTDEVLAGNRPTDHLNAIGYNNLYTKFNEKTKRGYNLNQFKSRWESLKKDYHTWKILMESQDDLGRDPTMNTISASPEWWAKKMEAIPDCGKFHSAPLENVELLNIMFGDMLDSSSATPNEANLAVNTSIRSEHGVGDGNDIGGIIDEDVNEQSKEAMLQKASSEEPSSTKPETSRVHAELNHPVNSDENVKPRNSATPMRVADRAGSNISEIMELVVDAGVEEGSDEHFIATQLFVRPEYREMFLTLKTPLFDDNLC